MTHDQTSRNIINRLEALLGFRIDDVPQQDETDDDTEITKRKPYDHRQYYADHKEGRRQYYLANRDARLAYQNQYNAEHKDERKEYQIANRDKRREYDREYRERNKDKIAERNRKYRLKVKAERDKGTQANTRNKGNHQPRTPRHPRLKRRYRLYHAKKLQRGIVGVDHHLPQSGHHR